MIEFLLVVMGTVIVALCVGAGQGGRRRLLILGGVFAAWLILPSIILQAHWGYYEEWDASAGADLWSAGPFGERPAQRAARVASGICGDRRSFEVDDSSVYYIAMDEDREKRHFFYHSKFSDVSWIGAGWGRNYCLMRYRIWMRREGELDWIPSPAFPWPFFQWQSGTGFVDAQLIDRVPTPTAPEGTRALLPGQCAWGEIPKGESRKFQVEMPSFVPTVRLVTHFLCSSGRERKDEDAFEWSKDGQSLGPIKAADGGGLYGVTLRAPGDEALDYGVAIGPHGGQCPVPKGWWEACESIPDPQDPERVISSRRKGSKIVLEDLN